jgi:glycine cleavage system aminomethyltransferase T
VRLPVLLDGGLRRRGAAMKVPVRDDLVQHRESRPGGGRATQELATRDFVIPQLSHEALLKHVLGEAKSWREYDRAVIATSEYELLTDSAGLLDRSERAKFVVRGGEAVDFLQGQVSNDVEALAPGTGCYATILNHKGKLRTDLRILRGEDFLWLDTEAIGHAVLRHMLVTYTLGRDVQWEDLTEDHAILSLIGPGADALAPEAPPRDEHSFTDSGAGLWVRTDLGLDVLARCRIRPATESTSEEVTAPTIPALSA